MIKRQDPPKLPHRDDVDMEVIKQLEEMFPDKKIVFMGDLPEEELPEDYQELLDQIDSYHRYSLEQGRCCDCGKKMPDFPPQDKDWKLPVGWNYLTNHNEDKPLAWICSKCNKVDENG